MPIRPTPFRQRCPRCGWQGPPIAPKSDALTPADFAGVAARCPRCDAEELETTPANSRLLDRLLGPGRGSA